MTNGNFCVAAFHKRLPGEVDFVPFKPLPIVVVGLILACCCCFTVLLVPSVEVAG